VKVQLPTIEGLSKGVHFDPLTARTNAGVGKDGIVLIEVS
jgi:hypothetical protein